MTSNLSVCIVHSFHHNRGGDTTYAHQIRGLLSYAGHNVYPFAMHHPKNQPTKHQRYFAPWSKLSQGSRQHIGDLTSLIWSRKAARSFAEALDQNKPDIVHVQHLHRHLTPAILKPAIERGIPIVWTLHDYELLCPSGKMVRQGSECTKCVTGSVFNALQHRCKWGSIGPSLLSAVEHGVHRILNVENWIDAYICPSQYLASILKSRVDPNKIYQYPNPVEILPYSPPTKKQWMIAGRLSKEKGFDVAIKAARMLPEHNLIICGDGPEREGLEALAGGATNIHFMGMIPQRAVQQHIKASQLIAVPSCWPENFPYAVIEAQALGRPVIGTLMGGIPEQIKDQQTGILIPPNAPERLAEAIDKLLMNPSFAIQMGQNAQNHIKEMCNPQRHVGNILELYTQLLENKDKIGSMQ